MKKITTGQQREALLNLAWDCASGWIDDENVNTWSNDKVKRVSENIIVSLTEGEE